MSIFGAVLFLEGIVARFFESFAVVVTVGVLVSLFVSLTLTPMPAIAARSAGRSATAPRYCLRRSRS